MFRRAVLLVHTPDGGLCVVAAKASQVSNSSRLDDSMLEASSRWLACFFCAPLRFISSCFMRLFACVFGGESFLYFRDETRAGKSSYIRDARGVTTEVTTLCVSRANCFCCREAREMLFFRCGAVMNLFAVRIGSSCLLFRTSFKVWYERICEFIHLEPNRLEYIHIVSGDLRLKTMACV